MAIVLNNNGLNYYWWEIMTIELKGIEQLGKAIDAISSFISEGNFRFSDSGISFKAVDPSQIVLVVFSMDKKAFEKYSIEPTFVGVDMVELGKILSRALPNDRLVLDLSDSEMLIKLEGDISRSFSLPLIDVSDEEVTVPKTSFDATVEINARILKEALKDASLFGSSVVLRVKGNELFVEARGSSGTLKSVAKQAKGMSVESKAEVVSKYSLNFLQNIVREADPEKKIKLELKSDAPMRVSYTIGASPIEFHLAHMML